MSDRRVVVTGLGVLAPNGIGVSNFEQALRTGKSAVQFDPLLKKVNFSCQVSARMPLSDEDIKKMNRELRLVKMRESSITFGMSAIKEAWEDAGFNFAPEKEPRWETGCIMGNEAPCIEVIEWAIPFVNSGQLRKIGSKTVQQSQNSGITGYVTQKLGLGNAVYSVAQACATGNIAISQAFERIQLGKADRMLAGSSEMQGKGIWAPFDALHALTRNSNDHPDKASCPMSNNASGLVPGTGAAVMVLEELEVALKRKAKIYAEVKAGFSNAGGQRNKGTMTLPNPEGMKRCIQKVLKLGRVDANEIDLISGHLTSTVADPIEIKAWSDALGRKGIRFPYINSLKSMIGHGFGSAGSVAALATVLQISKKFIHPSLNSEELHPDIAAHVDREKIPLQAIQDIEIKNAIQSSFGFGDVNTCVLFSKYD